MNQYLSDKIKILSAISIILVLYIHSGFQSHEIAGMAFNDKVQKFISGMIGRCAVPLFFIISGYLFFLKMPDGLRSIFGKMEKRVQTLLIPYIIANLFFVFFFVMLDFIPGVKQFMNGNLSTLWAKEWHTIIYDVFFSPVAFQLWFLRDLMILVIFAPVWYFLFKNVKWFWISIVFGCAILEMNFFPFFPLFWFALGGALIRKKCNTIQYNTIQYNTMRMAIPIFFLVLSVWQLWQPDNGFWKWTNIPITAIGVCAMWVLYDFVVSKDFLLSNDKLLNMMCSFTFFIYLFHEPTLNVVRKLIVFVLGKNEIGYLVSYLVSPWIFVVCAAIAGLVLKKYLPKLYGVAVGGR